VSFSCSSGDGDSLYHDRVVDGVVELVGLADALAAAITGTGSPTNRSSQFTVTHQNNGNNNTIITLHVTTTGPSIPDITFTVQR
jgi:hypothetical protein